MIVTAKIISVGVSHIVIVPPLHEHDTEYGRLVLEYEDKTRVQYLFVSINYMDMIVGKAKEGDEISVVVNEVGLGLPYERT